MSEICSSMDCSMPGFPVFHYLPEFAQTHVHWVSDAIQPSHPVTPFSSCPQSLSASESFPMSWLFASGGQSIRALSSTLQWIFRVDFLNYWLVWSPCCPKDSPESFPAPRFKNTTVLQCSVFFMVQLSHLYMTTGKTTALTVWTFVNKVMSLSFNTDVIWFERYLLKLSDKLLFQ